LFFSRSLLTAAKGTKWWQLQHSIQLHKHIFLARFPCSVPISWNKSLAFSNVLYQQDPFRVTKNELLCSWQQSRMCVSITPVESTPDRVAAPARGQRKQTILEELRNENWASDFSSRKTALIQKFLSLLQCQQMQVYVLPSTLYKMHVLLYGVYLPGMIKPTLARLFL